ncbi:MAG: PD-(D/E)XK nuclease family protein, partial [Actinobacteria bacterium]
RRRVPRPGALTDPHVLARLASQEVYAASEIESYLQCPFRWLVEKQLRAESLDLAVDALTRGTVAHAALRNLYERLPAEAGAVRVTAGCLPAACGLVDAAVDAALSEERVPADASDAMRADVVRLLLRHLRTEPESLHGFAPAHLEWSFGIRDEEGPVDLGGFSLKGCVDRIDEAADGSVIVIDYKTGGAVEVRDWAERGKVQLPLYAAAVAQRFGREVAGCFYRGLTKDSVKRFVGPYVEGRVTGGVAPKDALSADGFAEAVGDALGRAGAAVAGMRAGEIPAVPAGDASETCRYCPARGYCGRESR